MSPRFAQLGDRAILITLGAEISDHTVRLVWDAATRVEAANLPGVVDCVPAFASLAVHYEPAAVQTTGPHEAPYDALRRALGRALDAPAPRRRLEQRTMEIPVCYGGHFGPDLQRVADAHGMSADDVVALHARGRYTVHMIGFLPGFAYLGGLPEALATARLPDPRAGVPAGSVGIGGRQTGIYPMESPGGWNLIGRTPVRLFLPERDPPTLLQPGDTVRFRPIDAATFDSWGAA